MRRIAVETREEVQRILDEHGTGPSIAGEGPSSSSCALMASGRDGPPPLFVDPEEASAIVAEERITASEGDENNAKQNTGDNDTTPAPGNSQELTTTADIDTDAPTAADEDEDDEDEDREENDPDPSAGGDDDDDDGDIYYGDDTTIPPRPLPPPPANPSNTNNNPLREDRPQAPSGESAGTSAASTPLAQCAAES